MGDDIYIKVDDDVILPAAAAKSDPSWKEEDKLGSWFQGEIFDDEAWWWGGSGGALS